jgi:ATP-binding cassette subfamily C (CFTR/MRP) protein 1
MRARAGVVTIIYKKSLVLANNEHTHASGDIVNLMSVDVTRLQDFITNGMMMISGPLQVKLSI